MKYSLERFYTEQPKIYKCKPTDHKPERQDESGLCFENHRLFARKAFRELEDA